ncbi:MAG: hypothetical protein K0R15_2741 [Clostridiales bacterium]|jgi:uncharacterized protein YrzB (UPF0473 family)|nr:hypothetical protein [Clostridiales bacterium]
MSEHEKCCGGEHHEHNHDGDCGCGSEHDTITLTLDDGTVVECAVLSVFPAGDYDYVALLPITNDGEAESDEVFLYRYAELEDGEVELENIENDEEYEIVAEAFDALLDDEEYEELFDDEEE